MYAVTATNTSAQIGNIVISTILLFGIVNIPIFV